MVWRNASGISAAVVSLSWYASSVMMKKKESVMLVGDAASSLWMYAPCGATLCLALIFAVLQLFQNDKQRECFHPFFLGKRLGVVRYECLHIMQLCHFL